MTSFAKVALGNKTKMVLLVNRVFGQTFTRNAIFPCATFVIFIIQPSWLWFRIGSSSAFKYVVPDEGSEIGLKLSCCWFLLCLSMFTRLEADMPFSRRTTSPRSFRVTFTWVPCDIFHLTTLLANIFRWLSKLSIIKSTQYKELAPNDLRFTYQNLISWKSHEKNETKNPRPLVFSFSPIDLAFWCFCFIFPFGLQDFKF